MTLITRGVEKRRQKIFLDSREDTGSQVITKRVNQFEKFEITNIPEERLRVKVWNNSLSRQNVLVSVKDTALDFTIKEERNSKKSSTEQEKKKRENTSFLASISETAKGRRKSNALRINVSRETCKFASHSLVFFFSSFFFSYFFFRPSRQRMKTTFLFHVFTPFFLSLNSCNKKI